MKLIIANWKAYVATVKEAERLAKKVAQIKIKKGISVVLCPPFVFLDAVKKSMGRTVRLGAQDVFWKESGPYTGAITADMLKGLSVRTVIIGHSERRQHFLESDDIIRKKVDIALAEGFDVIICVGEQAREDAKAVPKLVGEQVRAALAGISKGALARITIAYEPIWAIGTGVSDTPDDALSAAIYIRKVVGDMFGATQANMLKVLYGGSVDSHTIRDFILQEGIDGVLVGRASTDKEEFTKMLSSL
ncbi:MAG: triose-phosphate isomerase [Candidatus Azambacteria bacterium]|nr:triose-phosphate isomerase [Candidatus Azambacteria bacterium]